MLSKVRQNMPTQKHAAHQALTMKIADPAMVGERLSDQLQDAEEKGSARAGDHSRATAPRLIELAGRSPAG